MTESEGKKLKMSVPAVEAARDRVEGKPEGLRDQSSDGDKERDTAKMISKTQWDPN